MPTDTETRLRGLARALLVDDRPVTLAELREHDRPVATDHVALDRHRRATGSRRRWIVAGALVTASAAAIVAVVAGPSGRPRTQVTSTTPTSPIDAPTPTTTGSTSDDVTDATSIDGRLVLDPMPGGWKVDMIDDDLLGEPGEAIVVSRLYVDDVAHPETATAIEVTTYPDTVGTPSTNGTGVAVDVAGIEGTMTTDVLGRRVLVLRRDDRWFELTARGVDDERLVAMAAATGLAAGGDSAVIGSTALLPEMVELAVGHRWEAWFLPSNAGIEPAPSAHWSDSDRLLWYVGVIDESAATAQLVWANEIRSAEVRGQPATVFTFADDPGYRGATWTEGGRTYLVGSRALGTDELLAMLDSLRPATDPEWGAIATALRPPPASIDPATGLPTAGGVLPTGVTTFPVLDEDVLDRDAAQSTFAYYSHFSAGIDEAGTSWTGAIGRWTGSEATDVVAVTVRNRESTMPAPPTSPGRIDGVSELIGSATSQVFTTRDGAWIEVSGSDVDVLYDAIERITVSTEDGQVVGYTWAGGPPAGLVELAPPFATSFTTGAFPMLSWRGRATLSVSPMPALNLVARSGLPISEIDTPLGPGYVVEAPDGGVLDLLVPLPDGTTLEVAPVAATPEQAVDMLSLQELLTLVGSVRLVTETEWIEAYDPMLPVVPRTDPVIDTTVAGPIQQD